MQQLTRQDRLFGLAITEIPRSHGLLAGLALGAVTIQATLIAIHLGAPYAAKEWGWGVVAEPGSVLDATLPGSLAAFFASFLCILGSLLCLVLARIDRFGPRPSRAWNWGAAAFGILALDATCDLRGMLGRTLDGGLFGYTLDSQFFVPALFLLLFGGFFGIAVWRLRRTPGAVVLLLLGYAAWTISYRGLGEIRILDLSFSAEQQAASTRALAMLGTTLILWALGSSLLASAKRNTPLALRQRPRLF